jgi:hypothetical protein
MNRRSCGFSFRRQEPEQLMFTVYRRAACPSNASPRRPTYESEYRPFLREDGPDFTEQFAPAPSALFQAFVFGLVDRDEER